MVDNSEIEGLTSEEYDELVEFSKKPELNLYGCSHVNLYYGVQSIDHNKKDVARIEELLKKVILNFVHFSNFTKQEPNRIRCQTYWGNGFTGVFYQEFNELKIKGK